MRKKILVVLAVLGSALNVSAQDNHAVQSEEHSHSHDGRIFIGGAVSYWNDTEDNWMTLDLCPEFGYIFNDKWAVGLLLGYEREKEMDGDIKFTSNAFKFSPFARYYYYHKGPFNLYLDGGFGLNFGNTKNSLSNTTTNFKGFEAGVRPGACIDLIEGLCLCLRFGFVGYRNQYFMGEEPGLSSNGFGIRFAPEEVMIGLELEF